MSPAEALLMRVAHKLDALDRVEGSLKEFGAKLSSLDEALRGDDKGRIPGVFRQLDKFETGQKDHEGRLIELEGDRPEVAEIRQDVALMKAAVLTAQAEIAALKDDATKDRKERLTWHQALLTTISVGAVVAALVEGLKQAFHASPK